MMNWAVWRRPVSSGRSCGWSWAKETPGWNFLPTPAFRRCVWLSGLRPWLPGSLRIADSGQAFPMQQLCILGRQTWPAWEPPCPLECPSPALPLVLVQAYAAVKRPARSTYWMAQGQKVSSSLSKWAFLDGCNASFAGPSCRRLFPRCYSASTRWIPSWFPTGRCGIPPAGVAENVLPSVGHFVRQGPQARPE